MSTVFDRKAAAWVRKRYLTAVPVVGTVTFQTDVSAYGGELEADIVVTWTEAVEYTTATGRVLSRSTRDVRKTIETRAFNYDLNGLITELMETEDPGEAP